jgi:hypothetical protein
MPYKNWILKRVFGPGTLVFLTFLLVSCSMGDEFLMPAGRKLIETDLSQYVDAPEVERSPSGGKSYSGVSAEAQWFEIIEEESKNEKKVTTDRFKAEKIYKVYITLTIKDSAYYFGETESFRYRDIKPEALSESEEVGPDKRKFAVTFPKLQPLQPLDPPPKEVYDYYNLQQYVPVPVTGEFPVWSVTRPDFTIAVEWLQKRFESAYEGGPTDYIDLEEGFVTFVSGKQYGADITIRLVKKDNDNDESEYKPFAGDYLFEYPDGTVGSQDVPDQVVSESERQIRVKYWATK